MLNAVYPILKRILICKFLFFSFCLSLTSISSSQSLWRGRKPIRSCYSRLMVDFYTFPGRIMELSRSHGVNYYRNKFEFFPHPSSSCWICKFNETFLSLFFSIRISQPLQRRIEELRLRRYGKSLRWLHDRQRCQLHTWGHNMQTYATVESETAHPHRAHQCYQVR